eukprot:c15363_g1_i1.p1 GENE.c15363_g1_i1~~c15363_g1_i1.p1  ORF type:complete len:257 (+),score=100.42 c15363_g1_i1:135-905(+)
MKSLKVISFNIWFDDNEQELRYKSIVDTIKKTNADIIGFQEVIPEFEEIIERELNLQKENSEYISKKYRRASYGCMLLVKRSLEPNFSEIILPSRMERTMIAAEIYLCDERTVFGTVHLESLSNHSTRIQQLAMIQREFSNFKSSVLFGDFNFCSYRNYHDIEGDPLENDCLNEIMYDYIDIWPHLHKDDEKGYTFNSEINQMIDHDEMMRYDRVIYRGTFLKPISIELLGTEPIGENVWQSDHFGLLATFEYQEN